MFYLFKNSSLSQLSQPVGLKYLAGTKLISESGDSGKLSLIKPLIQFLLDIADIVFTHSQGGRVLQHTKSGKLSSYGQTKTFFKKLPLKISSEGQEL